MIQPLRSIPIIGTSSLLRVGPPPCPALVLSFLWFFHLNFSLNIGATGSHVPHKSPNQVHATFMPDAAQAVDRFPLDLSWNLISLQFWHRPFPFDTSEVVRLRSSPWSSPDMVFCHAFSLTLTTLALYQCSSRWFEASSCKTASRDLPSSLAQPRGALISGIWGTILEKLTITGWLYTYDCKLQKLFNFYLLPVERIKLPRSELMGRFPCAIAINILNYSIRICDIL